MTISNTDNTIDSRDIIERIAELQSSYEDWQEENPELYYPDWIISFPDEFTELETLKSLSDKCDGCSDWEYGETLIHRDYFEEYMDDMIQDCYSIPDLPSFMTIKVDYDALEWDYFSVDFDGEEFLIRS